MAVLDSKTTDSEGKATLSGTINSKGLKTLTVSESTTDVSNDVNVVVIPVDKIDISVSDEIVSENVGSVITATVYANETPISNIKVNIDGESFRTDIEGKASKTYFGNGGGAYLVNVNTGSFESSVVLYDAIQYYNKAEGKNFNLKYSTTGSLYVGERNNGLEIAPTPYKTGYITFNYPNATDERWVFTFDVVNANNNTRILFGGIMALDLDAYRPSFKCEINQDGSMSVYMQKYRGEGDWLRLWDISSETLETRHSRKPMLGFEKNWAVIDNIKIYKLGELSP